MGGFNIFKDFLNALNDDIRNDDGSFRNEFSPLNRFRGDDFEAPPFLQPKKVFEAIKRQPQSFLSPQIFGTSKKGLLGLIGLSPGIPETSKDIFGNDNSKYTGVGTELEQEIFNVATMSGLDSITLAVQEAMAPGGEGMTPALMEQLSTGVYSLGSLINGRDDEGSQIAIDVINFITTVSDEDKGTPEYYNTLAEFGSRLPDPNAQTSEEEEATKLLKETNELALEQQRIATLIAQRTFERDGIMSVVQMLPASSRMGFLADIMSVPKFSQLFFGDFDGGASEGPYIGGVLGSTVPQSSGIPTLGNDGKPLIPASPAARPAYKRAG